MVVEESDHIKKDGQTLDGSEFKDKDGYAELVFKSCWYLIALVVFIFAGSIILMGIEGHYLMFDNLNKYEQREHFEQRLSQWLESDKPRARSLRSDMELNNRSVEEQYHQNYTRIQKVTEQMCNIANLKLKSWNNKTWGDSFMYSVSVMSTVGWGVYYPKTTKLKIITCLYLIFGIPIFAAMLNVISGILDSAEKYLLEKKTIRKYIGGDKCITSMQIIWAVLAVLLYAVVCDQLVEGGRDDVIEAHLEDTVLNYSWNFFISVYYTIITVTSIGFGDIYIYSPAHVLLNLKPILCMFLTAFLIALFSRIFTKLQS
ncbi:hypothetical protein ACHWQZ_G006090 [Mnemiopsis leidyi]